MPVTPEQIAIIKSTVPLLETGGVALTTYFYKLMLNDYPEVKTLFNQTHQLDGSQPRALAKAVLCYAKYIDALENLGDLVVRIVQKHVALNIQPEHYPIVGKCLLQAIGDVLGREIATDEVIAAWAAAYGQLADLLIGAEEAVYSAAAAAPGGWRGTRKFEIVEKSAEGDEITSFVLRPKDGGAVKSYLPGQYLGLRIHLPNGLETQRNYSLSSAPRSNEYRITVRRHTHGVVSQYLHSLNVGDELDVYPPAGAFVLDEPAATSSTPTETTATSTATSTAMMAVGSPHVFLVAGGIGATTLYAMAEARAKSNPRARTTFLHSCKHAADHPFRAALQALAVATEGFEYEYVYTRPREGDEADAGHGGRIEGEYLKSRLPTTGERAIVYVVGPKEFMRDVRAAAIEHGVAPSDVRYEFFGPHAELE